MNGDSRDVFAVKLTSVMADNDDTYSYSDDDYSDDDYSDYEVSFVVYELDEDGYELDSVEAFDDLDDAIKFAKSQEYPTHIVFVPEVDPDDDPNYADYLDYHYDYSAYEIVWSSK